MVFKDQVNFVTTPCNYMFIYLYHSKNLIGESNEIQTFAR